MNILRNFKKENMSYGPCLRKCTNLYMNNCDHVDLEHRLFKIPPIQNSTGFIQTNYYSIAV